MRLRIRWQFLTFLLIAASAALILSSISGSTRDLDPESALDSIAGRRVASKWRRYLSQQPHSTAPYPKLYFPRQCAVAGEACAKFVPSFILAGGELSGAAYVFDILRSHPQVVGTVDHQNSDALFEAGDEAFFEAYLDEFPTARQSHTGSDAQAVVGEHAPQYLYHSHISSQRLREFLPHVKIVFILRDPINRAYAQYVRGASSDHNHRSFEDLIELELDILRQCGHTSTNWKSFVQCHESSEIKVYHEAAMDGVRQELSSLARGMYYTALLPFLEQFPSSQLCVMRAETFLVDPSASFQQLARFLSIDPAYFSERFSHGNQQLTEAALFGYDDLPISSMRYTDTDSDNDRIHQQTPGHAQIPPLDLRTRYRLQKVFRQMNAKLLELFENGADDFQTWEYDVEQG